MAGRGRTGKVIRGKEKRSGEERNRKDRRGTRRKVRQNRKRGKRLKRGTREISTLGRKRRKKTEFKDSDSKATKAWCKGRSDIYWYLRQSNH